MAHRRILGIIVSLLALSNLAVCPVLGDDSQTLTQAIAWRAQFGLNTDTTFTTQIIHANGKTRYGPWLTSDEAAELDRRTALADQLEPVLRFVNQRPTIFGGTYFDQSKGNMDLYVIVTPATSEADQRAVLDLLPSNGKVHFVKGDRTRAELDSLQSHLMALAKTAGVSLSYSALDIRDNQVVFEGDLSHPALAALLRAHPASFRYRPGGQINKAACDPNNDPHVARDHCWPVEGGDQIIGNLTNVGASGPHTESCTMGFLSRPLVNSFISDSSHQLYALTAGHCFDLGTEVYQGSNGGSDPENNPVYPLLALDENGNPIYLYDENGNEIKRDIPMGPFAVKLEDVTIANGQAVDVGRIDLASSISQNTNSIWTGWGAGEMGYPGFEITGMKARNDQQTGTTICQNGVSTAINKDNLVLNPCGTITDLNYQVSNYNWNGVLTTAQGLGGDSGGSVYNASGNAYGTVVGFTPTGYMAYQPIDDVLSGTQTRLCLDSACGPFGGFTLTRVEGTTNYGISYEGTTNSSFLITDTSQDSSGSAPVYDWGDGTVTANATPHAYAQPGTYHFAQTVTSPWNSQSQDEVGTYVTIVEDSPTFSWNSNLPGNALVAQTQAIFLTDSENGYTGCHWDWGDGTTDDYCAASVLHTFPGVGYYTVSLTLSNPGQGIGPYTASATVPVIAQIAIGIGGSVLGYPTSTDETGAPLNYWASIQGPCAAKAEGDPYATKVTTSVPLHCATATTTNSEYYGPAAGAPGPYNYLVNVQAAGPVSIDLYDPQFCPRSSPGFDAGDTNFSGGYTPVFSTTFTLYAPSSTPTDPSDDQVMSAKTYPGDESTLTNDGQAGATHSCSSYYVTGSGGNYTGKWLNLTGFTAPSAGVYRLNVQTSWVGTNRADGDNQFAVRASSNGGSGTQPIITATSSNGLPLSSGLTTIASSGNHEIRLAQVNANAAGHTLEIDLFDPGDLGVTSSISLESPTSGGYQTASVNWRDAGTTLGSGGTMHYGVSSITTSNGSTAVFDGHWLVVTLAIPSDYSAPQGGWFKLKYTTSGTRQDRLVWRASIQN